MVPYKSNDFVLWSYHDQSGIIYDSDKGQKIPKTITNKSAKATSWWLLPFFHFCVFFGNLVEVFLVGAFSFKEKSPTITVASFFFFFFFVRPQSSSRMYHFLQKLISSLRPSSTNANLLQRVLPPFVFYLFYVTYKTGRLQRVPPFNFFSHCANFFFENFKFFQKSPPFGFFDILQQKVC